MKGPSSKRTLLYELAPLGPRKILEVQIEAEKEQGLGVVATENNVVLHRCAAQIRKLKIEANGETLAVFPDGTHSEADLAVERKSHRSLFGLERGRIVGDAGLQEDILARPVFETATDLDSVLQTESD
jgi:hypothetical protein